MGRSSGTGQPVWFRCSSCRSRGARCGDHTFHLTGRTKPAPRGGARGRSTDTLREYKCTCGHRGWSRHVDLKHRSPDED